MGLMVTSNISKVNLITSGVQSDRSLDDLVLYYLCEALLKTSFHGRDTLHKFSCGPIWAGQQGGNISVLLGTMRSYKVDLWDEFETLGTIAKAGCSETWELLTQSICLQPACPWAATFPHNSYASDSQTPRALSQVNFEMNFKRRRNKWQWWLWQFISTEVP